MRVTAGNLGALLAAGGGGCGSRGSGGGEVALQSLQGTHRGGEDATQLPPPRVALPAAAAAAAAAAEGAAPAAAAPSGGRGGGGEVQAVMSDALTPAQLAGMRGQIASATRAAKEVVSCQEISDWLSADELDALVRKMVTEQVGRGAHMRAWSRRVGY